MPRQDVSIKIDGLKELQRDIKRVQPALKREVPKALGDAAKTAVLPGARMMAPKRTGRLSASLRVSQRQTGALIGSRLPYANVIHWGGNVPSARSTSTRPKRRFEATLFINKAATRNQVKLVDDTWNNLRLTFRRHGWTK
jgi:phage gpG-like protein